VDLFDVVRACFRRWYIVLPLLVIAVWITHHMYASVKPVYYANAVIGLSPPSRVEQTTDGSPAPRNGLLDVGGATLIANMTTLSLHDTSVAMQVVAGGGKPNYVARMFPVPGTTPQLPMIMIEATEAEPTSALKTVELVVAQADPVVQALQQQAGVPAEQMVRTFSVSPPSGPATAMPSRTRSTIAVGVAGFGIAVLLAVIADLILLRWKARRQKRKQAQAQTPDTADFGHRVGPERENLPASDTAPLPDGAPEPLSPPLHQRTVPEHPEYDAQPTYATAPGVRANPVYAPDSSFGVDPAEAYSQSKHSAPEQVRTDGQ